MSKRKASGSWYSYMESERYSHNVLARALSATKNTNRKMTKTLSLKFRSMPIKTAMSICRKQLQIICGAKNNAAPLSREIWKILKKENAIILQKDDDAVLRALRLRE